MTRVGAIQRWIDLLEREPRGGSTQFRKSSTCCRPTGRSPAPTNRPLTVAYEDPVLPHEGLASDRLGDAMDFFELTENEAHHAFCSCLGGHMMDSSAFARRLRDATVGRARIVSGAWILGGLALCLPGLLYLAE